MLALSLSIALTHATAQTSANDYVKSGYAKAKKGDLDGAIADFNRAIELDPKKAGAYTNRGSVRNAKGDLDGAIADRRFRRCDCRQQSRY